MSRPAITAAAFAVSAGEPVDALGTFHVAPEPCPHGRRLVISVEPLEPTPSGATAASSALAVLRRSIASDALLPPALALIRAFAAANAALLAEHRPPVSSRRGRDTLVGATAALLVGRELTVAQVPPTQAIVAQDRRLYAFPDLASWRPDFVPVSDDPEPEPLGCREGTRPALYRTLAAPGDLILLCSSPLARRLGRDPAAIAALRADAHAAGSGADVHATQLDAALERLGLLAARHGLEDAHAAAIAVGRLPASFGGRRALREGLDRIGEAWGSLGRRSSPAPVPGRSAIAPAMPEVAPAMAWAGGAAPEPIAPRMAEAAGGGGRRSSVGGAPTPASRRRLAWRRSSNRPTETAAAAHRPKPVPFPRIGRAGPVPGADSVQRYTGQSAAPAEWRGILPRGPDLRLPGRALTVTTIVFATFGGSGLALEQHLNRSARAEAALATVEASLAALAGHPSEADVANALGEADAALAAAHEAGVSTRRLAERQRAVDGARDQAWGIVRFAELSRVGTLPSGVAGASARLVRAGDRVFLVAGALYELDRAGSRLVRHLGPGDRVGGGVVAPLRFAAADGGGVIVGDGAALYVRDASGSWTRRPLPPSEGKAPWPEMPTAVYQKSLYALTAPGEIVKLPLAEVAPPLPWADAEDAPNLLAARDLVIDGRVHVLLGDGRIQTLFRGAPEATISPAVWPPVADAVALAGGPDTTALYLLDRGAAIGTTAGRILLLSPGDGPRQILPPVRAGEVSADPAAHALAAAHDLVVDEVAGVVYLITDGELWRGVLPDDGATRF